MAVAYERVEPETATLMTEALEPPNRINRATGLPYGWDEDDELAGLDDALTG